MHVQRKLATSALCEFVSDTTLHLQRMAAMTSRIAALRGHVESPLWAEASHRRMRTRRETSLVAENLSNCKASGFLRS